MAATNAKAGFGSLLKRGDGGGTEVFTTIAEVKDINGPAMRQMFEDATHQESPGGFEEFVPTVRQSGDVTCTCNLLAADTTQALLRADLLAGTKHNYRLTIPGTGKRISFAAYVQELGPAVPLKGVITMDVSFKVTGPSTLEADV